VRADGRTAKKKKKKKNLARGCRVRRATAWVQV
jgi:hypothetical protein